MKTIVIINEVDYELIYDINTLCDMTAAGFDVMNMENVKINMIVLRQLFYFGLKKEVGKSLTEKKAGDLMTQYLQEGNKFGDLLDTVLGALGHALGNDTIETFEGEGEEVGN